MLESRQDTIRRMLAAGATYQAIGDAIELTRERVRQIARDLGVEAQSSRNSRRAAREKKLARAPGVDAKIASKTGIALARLRLLLDYDRYTGIFRWRSSGRVAGTHHKDGYIQIRIDGALYMAHVLAWLYAFEQWPKNEIDHINRHRDDNRLDNLRAATRSQNLGNSEKRKHNQSGFKGVWPQGDGKFRAEIAHVKLGTFDTAEQAADVYKEAARRRYGNHTDDGA